VKSKTDNVEPHTVLENIDNELPYLITFLILHELPNDVQFNTETDEPNLHLENNVKLLPNLAYDLNDNDEPISTSANIDNFSTLKFLSYADNDEPIHI
jgi:hypothetical protein